MKPATATVIAGPNGEHIALRWDGVPPGLGARLREVVEAPPPPPTREEVLAQKTMDLCLLLLKSNLCWFSKEINEAYRLSANLAGEILSEKGLRECGMTEEELTAFFEAETKATP